MISRAIMLPWLPNHFLFGLWKGCFNKQKTRKIFRSSFLLLVIHASHWSNNFRSHCYEIMIKMASHQDIQFVYKPSFAASDIRLDLWFPCLASFYLEIYGTTSTDCCVLFPNEERLWTPYDKVAKDTTEVTERLAHFRCLLNQRGVAAAPLTGWGRAAPMEPGSCYKQ